MLKLQNIQSGYEGSKILRDVNMHVNTGEIVAIIGPNGSGKSTILKSIFNIANIYSGNIFLEDKNITKLPTENLIREGISYVPQGRQVFSNLTVFENLKMGLFTFNNKKYIKENIKNIFEKFPILKQKQNQYAFSLSGGQQQTLAIARALVQNPKILLLDEPSLGLSPKTTKEIFEKIQEINRQGVSILIVEQNARQAVQIANRTYIFEGGEVALEGGCEILKDPRIRDIYFGGI